MSGYVIGAPDTVLTTVIQDNQGPGAINAGSVRTVFASAMSSVPNTQTGSYTLLLSDAWKCIEYFSISPGNLFIPTDASVNFQIGMIIGWFVMGAGALTIVQVTPGTTTLRYSSSNVSRAQNTSGAIRKRAANDWVLMGDLL